MGEGEGGLAVRAVREGARKRPAAVPQSRVCERTALSSFARQKPALVWEKFAQTPNNLRTTSTTAKATVSTRRVSGSDLDAAR